MNMKRFFALAISLIIMAVALCSCGSKEPVIKPTPLGKFQATATIQQQWSNGVSMNAKNGSYLKMTPAFANGKAFIAGNSGRIKAIDLSSGKTLWQVSTKSPISSGVGVNNSSLFVGTSDGQVLALQQNDGKLIWKAKVISDVLATPAASNDVVVVKTEVGSLNAFRAQNGQVLWNYEQNNPSLILHGSSSPKIVDDQVICGFANGEMKAFALKTGNVRWQQQAATPSGSFLVERMVDIIADPVIYGNTVYVVAYHGNTAAINIHNGNILWQKPLPSISGLSVDANNVYVADSNDQLWALTKSAGNAVWHQNAFAHRSLSGPAVLNNLVAVGDAEGYVHWLNAANGLIAARAKVSGGITVPPIPYNNAVYVFSASGNLTKFTTH